MQFYHKLEDLHGKTGRSARSCNCIRAQSTMQSFHFMEDLHGSYGSILPAAARNCSSVSQFFPGFPLR